MDRVFKSLINWLKYGFLEFLMVMIVDYEGGKSVSVII